MAAKETKQMTSSTVGFEQQLWAAADKMRGHMDPAEYKHVALGLIFLKYISDAFEEKHTALSQEAGANPEDRDEYLADNVFWVPMEARWKHIQAQAKTPQIGKIIDDAMISLENDNHTLKGVLPRDYARPALDKTRLGELIDLISKIGMGNDHRMSKDTLGRVYEYFLSRFAGAEGKGGGEFYTPQSVVRLLVEMLEPYKGRIYDPCCGSGGMFVQSEKFIEQHGGRVGDISVYGQESNFTTWRLAKMNLAIRGIEGNIGSKNADTFHNNLHKDMKADYIIANPPFNISDWGGERLRDDVRWQYGIPPVGNANYAWVQHMVHHLSPRGFAGFVLANGSMSSNTSGEGEIRKSLIEADIVDCMVALPGQLFYSTQIPVCLWFLAKDRSNGLVAKGTLRDRRKEILFIDARKLGYMETRVNRSLSDDDLAYIADCYHSWRGEPVEHPEFKDGYKDIAGFCKSTKLDEVHEHGYVLTPGRYVGAEEQEEDSEVFAEKMQRLTNQLAEQMQQSQAMDTEIKKQLARVGFKL